MLANGNDPGEKEKVNNTGKPTGMAKEMGSKTHWSSWYSHSKPLREEAEYEGQTKTVVGLMIWWGESKVVLLIIQLNKTRSSTEE